MPPYFYILSIFGINTGMFSWCFLFLFFLHFRQNCPRGKKKLDVHVKVYFAFLPVSVYLTIIS